jgi:hypothetical protein
VGNANHILIFKIRSMPEEECNKAVPAQMGNVGYIDRDIQMF